MSDGNIISKDSEDEDVVPFSSQEVLRSMAIVKRFVADESEERADRTVLRDLRAYQGLWRTRCALLTHQTRIEFFF